MNLKPESARLTSIGRQAGDADKQWATLELRFKDADVDHSYSANLTLLVPKRPDVTLREIQEVARQTAVVLLREAADLLERESIEVLEQIEDDRAAAAAADLRDRFGSFDQESLP